MIWAMVRGFNGVHLWGIFIPTHYIFCDAILDDMSNYFVNSVFVAVRLWHASTLIQRLVFRDVVIVNMDVMSLVEVGWHCQY